MYLSSGVSLRKIRTNSGGILQVGFKLTLLQAILELGEDSLASRLNLLPLLQHHLVLLGLEEAGIDVVHHQLVDLFLGSGEGVARRVLGVSFHLFLDVGTDVHLVAASSLEKFTAYSDGRYVNISGSGSMRGEVECVGLGFISVL